MKKIRNTFYILILVIAAAALCGAGWADSAAGADQCCGLQHSARGTGGAGHSQFDEMAEVHIFTDAVPEDEYVPAVLDGEWTGGQERNASAEKASSGKASAGKTSISGASIEIKQRGNSTRGLPKKSFNIKFEDEQKFLGMDAGKKWALISCTFDKSLLRSVVGFSYAERIGLDYVPQTRLCKVWIDGVYMGVYTAAEPVEAGAGRVEIDPDGGDFLLERNLAREEDDKTYIISPAGLRFEFNEPEEPDAEQVRRCFDLLMAAEASIQTCDYMEYSEYIDVQSFVDFYIFSEVIKDVDLGEYSTRYYFEDGVLHIGPPWDLDLSQGNISTEKDEFKYVEYNNLEGAGDGSGDSASGLWADGKDYYYWLCQDPWFCRLVEYRWQALRPVTENLVMENELGRSLIDQYLDAHEAELEGNFGAGGAGWGFTPDDDAEYQQPAGDYAGNVEFYRSWLSSRIAYLDRSFAPDLLKPLKGYN